MRKIIAVLALALPAAACTPVDANMGGALKHNYAQQIVDPDPDYAGEPNEGGNGKRAAAAAKRYNDGNVKAPAAESVSSVGGGGGSGPR